MTFGVWEIAFILILVLIILGTGRLSEWSGAVGKTIRAFRQASTPERPAARPAAPGPAAPTPAAPSSAAPSSAAAGTATLAGPTVVVENKCPSCGTINPPGQVFCGQCGTRLTIAA